MYYNYTENCRIISRNQTVIEYNTYIILRYCCITQILFDILQSWLKKRLKKTNETINKYTIWNLVKRTKELFTSTYFRTIASISLSNISCTFTLINSMDWYARSAAVCCVDVRPLYRFFNDFSTLSAVSLLLSLLFFNDFYIKKKNWNERKNVWEKKKRNWFANLSISFIDK